nr:glycosyltransferase family 2 protein [uncultured Flavobacterium sp.]
MRIGNNPQRNKEIENNEFYHQIIIPVYIPSLEGYYKDAFEIFKIHIQSILKTIHIKTYISIVANGCCETINNYLIELKKSNIIHEVVITQAIGKINAILKALVGNKFQFITITDADVLYTNNWQKATYDVFESFPKTGYVCTTPTPKTFSYLTSNIWQDNFLNKNIKFIDIPNVDAVKNFATSVGNPNFFKDQYLQKFLVIENKKGVAVLGGGHFTGTYRSDVFFELYATNTNDLLGNKSEFLFLDQQVLNFNLWRLSTVDNYTYHLGNVLEKWMYDKVNSLNYNSNLIIENSIEFNRITKLGFLSKSFLKLFRSKKVFKLYFWLHRVDNFYKL